jgi:lysophospholipase L1-like esterase
MNARRLGALGLGIALAAVGVVHWSGSSEAEREYRESVRQIDELLRARSAGGPGDGHDPAAPPDDPRSRPWYLPPEVAGLLFKLSMTGQRYDPWCYYARLPHTDVRVEWPEHPRRAWRLVSNSDGLREDREIARERPGLRVLVTGDSHTDGWCDNAESFSNLLEAELARRNPGRTVEVLNAGNAGYSFHNYLGVLAKWRALAPDVFVVCVYGGNDFRDVLAPAAYFRREPPWPFPEEEQEEVALGRRLSIAGMTNAFRSLFWFRRHPESAERALADALELCAMMSDECREMGTRLVVLYLPTAVDVDRELRPELFRRWIRKLGFSAEDLAIHARMGERLLAQLRAAGIETLDLTEALRARGEPCYWARDLHLNLAGHAVVAEAMVPIVERAWQR